MVEKLQPYWPESLFEQLHYLQWKKPLYRYLEQHGTLKPDEELPFIVTTNYNDYLPENPAWPLPEELSLPKQRFSKTDDFIFSSLSPQENTEKVKLWEDVGIILAKLMMMGDRRAVDEAIKDVFFLYAAKRR